MVAILFILFFVFLIIGLPIAFALALSSMISLFVGSGDISSLLVVVQKIFGGIDSFPIMAIPLFILAGNLMTEAKISDKLLDFASLLVGRTRAGLTQTTTAASAFFGAISGSSPATTAAIGSIMIPNMEKKGYEKTLSASVVAASGLLGLIIPPSITMIMYGVTAGVSIGDLFLAGIVPGVILTLLVMVLNHFIMKKHGISPDNLISKEGKIKVIKNSVLALLMPIIILGGIYGGIFTPTESAAVACFYGLIVGFFIYRTLSFKSLFLILKKTAESTALIMLILATAKIFGYIIALEQVPQQLAEMVLDFTDNRYIIMLILLVGLLILGTFLDNVPAIVLAVPAISGIIQQAGIDPTYFGVFMVIALAVGQITPPVGNNLFVAANIAGVKFESLVKRVVPYICLYIAFLIVSIFVPGILTFFVG